MSLYHSKEQDWIKGYPAIDGYKRNGWIFYGKKYLAR